LLFIEKNHRATTTTSLEEQKQVSFQKSKVFLFQNKTSYIQVIVAEVDHTTTMLEEEKTVLPGLISSSFKGSATTSVGCGKQQVGSSSPKSQADYYFQKKNNNTFFCFFCCCCFFRLEFAMERKKENYCGEPNLLAVSPHLRVPRNQLDFKAARRSGFRNFHQPKLYHTLLFDGTLKVCHYKN
jgi:hypothetical protein